MSKIGKEFRVDICASQQERVSESAFQARGFDVTGNSKNQRKKEKMSKMSKMSKKVGFSVRSRESGRWSNRQIRPDLFAKLQGDEEKRRESQNVKAEDEGGPIVKGSRQRAERNEHATMSGDRQCRRLSDVEGCQMKVEQVSGTWREEKIVRTIVSTLCFSIVEPFNQRLAARSAVTMSNSRRRYKDSPAISRDPPSFLLVRDLDLYHAAPHLQDSSMHPKAR
ncbi:uncharacterized protein UDID_07661 [Ustilago sp. UG-2017a]|nr:uncharacterized protein UDID_07661 [Ustilago sp. UG-2017a]